MNECKLLENNWTRVAVSLPAEIAGHYRTDLPASSVIAVRSGPPGRRLPPLRFQQLNLIR